MAYLVIAQALDRYNCYTKFRLLDLCNGEVRDVDAQWLNRELACKRIEVRNLIKYYGEHYEKDTVKFINCDSSRMCYLDTQGNAKINQDGILAIGDNGDYIKLVNYTGQIITVHKLQLINNVRKRKFYLINGEVTDNSVIYRL